MAIFDSEKRPRGLRVPSLTAMKAGTAASVSQFSFHRSKSNESRTPEEESVPVIPSTGSSYPPPAPPPTKDLPIPPSGPKKELPPRPSLSTKVPPRKSVGSNTTTTTSTPRPTETSPSEAHGLRSAFSAISPAISTSPPKQEQPLPPTPSLGLRQAGSTTTPVSPPLEQDPESPATIKAPQGIRQTETPVSPQLSKPQPVPVQQQQQQQQSLPPTPPVAPQNTPPEIEAKAPIPARVPVAVPAPAQQLQNQQLPPTPPPVTLSTPPTEEESEALTPLEDFIPTPEGATTPLELDPMSSNEASGPPGLADIEPVAAPLNKVHFACFQEHRNMPIAQNVWCPVPCMTCHKHDQEIRHRCVFCSLRICEGCYRSLQKMKSRSLTALMDSLGSTSAQ